VNGVAHFLLRTELRSGAGLRRRSHACPVR
jgi:hypothetical protein